jgi:hypothetical protein
VVNWGYSPMLSIAELRGIARTRLEEAEVLFHSGRYDGAAYLCGYAVEAALKTRICQTLSWAGYPSTGREFRGYESFRTHNLEVLLNLSGIRNNFSAEWLPVSAWDPEMRYKPIGSANEQAVGLMIECSRVLLGVI